MSAMNTMLLIVDAFVSLCDEMPLQKVSISDIVERTGKNRKTFYYHFVDKNYLIDWIFRYDLGQVSRALERWQAALNISNLFDKEYVSRCTSDAACFYGNRRLILGSLVYKW